MRMSEKQIKIFFYFKNPKIQYMIIIIKMKKLISLFLSLILASSFCFCLENFHFSVAPRVSVTCGELNELLYDADYTLMSQLDWEQKPLLDLGITSTATFNNFILKAGFDYSIPLGTSYMYDSDWEDGEKYSLTKHPLKKSQNLNAELSGAYSIEISQKLCVIPELQLNYLYNNFNADIGNGVRWGRNIRVYGIDYLRHSFFVFTGLSVQAELNPKLILTTDFFAAPWNYQYCMDHHHGIKHPFTSEEVQHGFFSKYKTGVTMDILLTKYLSLQCFTKLLFGFSDKGTLYTDYYNSGTMEYISYQKTGSTIRSIKSGTAVKFNF